MFQRDKSTISRHINTIFSEGELDKNVVVAKYATTTQHGAIKGKTQTKKVDFYNLDVIISVGYRVKSLQGTQFRIWATKTKSKQLALDVQKANTQYGNFDVKQFSKSHDRFIIINNGTEIYHIGASLKDLGRRWFAFQKMDKDSVAGIISAISGLI